jgi:hypothetical protein
MCIESLEYFLNIIIIIIIIFIIYNSATTAI